MLRFYFIDNNFSCEIKIYLCDCWAYYEFLSKKKKLAYTIISKYYYAVLWRLHVWTEYFELKLKEQNVLEKRNCLNILSKYIWYNWLTFFQDFLFLFHLLLISLRLKVVVWGSIFYAKLIRESHTHIFRN